MTLIRDFYALHRIPELDCTLPKTYAYVKQSLYSLRCTITTPTEGSICAYFDFGRDDAVAFRADLDALPIQEDTGLSYTSLHAGQMHACGHDGHTAILLELARRLHQKRTLPHNVLLIFQPGEEQKGGAKLLCDSGILEKYKVRFIFGLHLWPKLSKGKNLEPAAVRQDRTIPVHEPMEPASLFHDLVTRPQIQMIGVGQNDLSPHLLHLFRAHGFHSCLGTHRHEHRRLNISVWRMDHAAAGPCLLICM